MKAGAVEAVGADDAEGLARRTRFAFLAAPLFDEPLGRVGAAGKHKAPLAVLVALGRVGDADARGGRVRLAAVRLGFGDAPPNDAPILQPTTSAFAIVTASTA